jgi:hypothetical protein
VWRDFDFEGSRREEETRKKETDFNVVTKMDAGFTPCDFFYPSLLSVIESFDVGTLGNSGFLCQCKGIRARRRRSAWEGNRIGRLGLGSTSWAVAGKEIFFVENMAGKNMISREISTCDGSLTFWISYFSILRFTLKCKFVHGCNK